jgi:RNA polymerase sigma-70 factor, ECF subfamily
VGTHLHDGTSEETEIQVTYALETTSSGRQSNEVVAGRPLPIFRTLKKSVRSAPSKTPSYSARGPAETREEVLTKEALEEMFVASRKRFLAIAYSILRNREDAQDAVQDAFLSAYRHVRSFEGRSALRTWLTRIVMNAALMMQRKRRPSAPRPLSESAASHGDDWTETIPDAQPDPEMIHSERETLQLIDGILGKMKPMLRQAFTLTYFDELSGAEACNVLGVSSGTFKARLFRARRQLMAQAERTLVTPMHKTQAPSSESWKPKGLRSVPGQISIVEAGQ